MKEMEYLEFSNKLLFIDTDCLITKFYIHFLDNNDQDNINNENLADAISEINRYNLVLFLEPDVEFIQDGTRNEEIQKNREFYSKKIKTIFDSKNIKYECITGTYQERFKKSIKIINEKLLK